MIEHESGSASGDTRWAQPYPCLNEDEITLPCPQGDQPQTRVWAYGLSVARDAAVMVLMRVAVMVLRAIQGAALRRTFASLRFAYPFSLARK